jgi:hypothetical protein
VLIHGEIQRVVTDALARVTNIKYKISRNFLISLIEFFTNHIFFKAYFTGPNCQICISKPCNNSTSMINLLFDCDSCVYNPCLNGGSCIFIDSKSLCLCPRGYYGRRCEFYLSNMICYSGDINSTSCSRWANTGFCDFIYSYNEVPVPICKRNEHVYFSFLLIDDEFFYDLKKKLIY